MKIDVINQYRIFYRYRDNYFGTTEEKYSSPFDEDDIESELKWYKKQEDYLDVTVIKETVHRQVHFKPKEVVH